MGISVWLMDAFTDAVFGGNPAGVVPNASGLTDEVMQSIAQELHASETAFVLPPDDMQSADIRLRYFTPSEEVDLCGHATIGAICGLVLHGHLKPANAGTCRVQTNVGVLPIRYAVEGGLASAEMRQAVPQFRAFQAEGDELTALLGIHREDVDAALPLGLAYTGLWDLFVPVRSLAVMNNLTPDLNGLAKFNKALGVASTHVYTAETVDRAHHFHARDFSPALGIPEDPATGTATGALLALLHRRGLVSRDTTYSFEQGYEIGRPSVIEARVAEAGEVQVYVGGKAVCSLTGSLSL